MKNLYLLVCILAAGLIFTSCKKDNKDSTPESSIMGKWKGEKMIVAFSMNGSVVESDTTFWKTPDYLSVEFKKNNQMVSQEFSDNELDTEEFYYVVKGNKISLMENANDPKAEEYTFKIEKNKLILLNSTPAGTVIISSEIHLKK